MNAPSTLKIDFDTDRCSISNVNPRVRGRIRITPNMIVESTVYPNAWRRFWYWALLGWRWEKVIQPKELKWQG